MVKTVFNLATICQYISNMQGETVSTKACFVDCSDSSSDTHEECNAGYLQDRSGIRVVPNCQTAAVEEDGRVNKTKATVKWIAPSCGCVHIRYLKLHTFTNHELFVAVLVNTIFFTQSPLIAESKHLLY